MQDDLIERLQLIAELSGVLTSSEAASIAAQAADHIEALEAEVERLRDDSWFDQFEEQEQLRDNAEQRLSVVEAENERLRGVLEAVWKEATTMRNASKLVGPYPKEPANNRVWARSMYHAGKKLHELIKPARAALGEKK